MNTSSRIRYVMIAFGLFVAASMSSACGGDLAKNDDEVQVNEESQQFDPIRFTSPQLSAVTVDYPVAVGALVTVRVRTDYEVRDITMATPGAFEIEDIDGKFIDLVAVEEGTSEVAVVATDDESNDYERSFELAALKAHGVDVEVACVIPTAVDLLAGTETDWNPLWFTNESYAAELHLESESGESLAGFDTYPLDVEPEGALSFIDDSMSSGRFLGYDQLVLTGPDEGVVRVHEPDSESAHEIELIHSEGTDEVKILRVETGGETSHVSITEPGTEPVLDLVENERYYFLAHRFRGGQIACEPLMATPPVRVTTSSPDVCMVDKADLSDFYGSDEELEPADPKEEVLLEADEPETALAVLDSLGRLLLQDRGECVVQIEMLDGLGQTEIIEEFRWIVE